MVSPGVYRHHKGQQYEVLGLPDIQKRKRSLSCTGLCMAIEASGLDPSPCLLRASRREASLFRAFHE